MADINRMMEALRNADAAGDTEAATSLAGMIRKQDNDPLAGASGRDLFAPAQEPQPDSMPWSDVAVSAVKNIPSSAGAFASDIAQPFIHPIDTAKSIGTLGLGIIQKLIPGEQADEKMADAVGKFFLDRYGNIENVKKTLATDPVGMLSDVTMVLSGGGTLAARAPGIVGKAGKAVQTAGRVADPLTLAGQAAKYGGKGVATAGAHLIGDLGTHTGAESLRGAARAGMEGGETGRVFLDNLRGNVPMERVIEDAKLALDKMRQERGQAYRSGMAGVKADNTVLDFGPIDDALREVSEVGVYKGKVLNKSTEGVWQNIAETVDDWRTSNPADFHTAEGLDALKKAIGDIRETTEYGTPSRVMADRVYNSIREQVVKQAPDYARVMKDYETASDLLGEIQKTLSLNPKANIDTTLRKLQSVMRNNANTNYGRRVDLVNKLGSDKLMPALSGQSLNSLSPRGLGRVVAGGTLAGSVGFNPALAALLPFQSPRLVGEAAYYGGKLSGKARQLAEKLGPRRARALGQESFQAGRITEEDVEGRLARLLLRRQ